MAEFTGKVAVVTGAASGIGRTCAQFYAREGARVVVSDIDEEQGRLTTQLIRDAGGEAIFARTDVSNPADCETMVRRAVETYGRLDYACNNAGIGGEQNPTSDYSVEGWQKVIGPAFIQTPLLAALEQDPEMLRNLVSLHPIGRLGKPEEVAELVVWLSSDKASFVTGAYYAVDGGYLAR